MKCDYKVICILLLSIFLFFFAILFLLKQAAAKAEQDYIESQSLYNKQQLSFKLMEAKLHFKNVEDLLENSGGWEEVT